jgi:hypothetical protein
MANAPLAGRDGSDKKVICSDREAKIFTKLGWTGGSRRANQLQEQRWADAIALAEPLMFDPVQAPSLGHASELVNAALVRRGFQRPNVNTCHNFACQR